MYDFDRVYDRRPYNSVKWSGLEREASEEGEEVLPLWVADMDFASPPEVAAALEARAAHPIYGYAGLPEGFHEAFEGWMLRRHGLAIERDWCRFSPGIVPGLALALRALTREGEGVLIQPPVYHPFARLIRENGRRVVESPLVQREGRWTMDFESLEAALDTGVSAMILCSPHNPVGRVWSAEELERLAELLAARELILLSDEIHADIVYAPRRHRPSLALSPALAGRTLAFYSPSKTFNLAGLQTSYAVIPDPGLRRRYGEELERVGLGNPNLFGVLAAETAYRQGGPWLEELLAYLEGNERYLRAELASRLPGAAMSPLEGTYLAWIDLRKARVEGGLRDFLMRKAGLWIEEGVKFGSGGEGWIRLNLACPRSTLEEAVERLVRALRGRMGK